MVDINEYIAYLGRDNERIQKNFAMPEPVITSIEAFNEQILPIHTNTLIEKTITGGSNWASVVSTSPGSPFLDDGKLQLRGFLSNPLPNNLILSTSGATAGTSPGGSTTESMVTISGGNWCNFASGQNFTIEFFFNGSFFYNADAQPVTMIYNVSGNNTQGWEISLRNGSVPEFQIADNATVADTIRFMGVNAANNVRHHLAVGRETGSIFMYYDGTGSKMDITSNTDGSIVNVSSHPLTLGRRFTNSASAFVGSMQEFRISNTARYSSNFTIGSPWFNLDSNTLLLAKFNETISGPTTIQLLGTPTFGSIVSGARLGNFEKAGVDLPRYFIIGSSNTTWNGSQTNLQGTIGSFPIYSGFSIGIQNGSFQSVMPIGSWIGSNIQEWGIKSSGSIYIREVISGFNIDTGSDYRFTLQFKVGS